LRLKSKTGRSKILGPEVPYYRRSHDEGQSEVDHCDSPFREQVDNDLTLDGLKGEVRFLYSQKRWYFKHSDFEARWAGSYLKNAKLCYVSKPGNCKEVQEA
jgi:hypothetical protein